MPDYNGIGAGEFEGDEASAAMIRAGNEGHEGQGGKYGSRNRRTEQVLKVVDRPFQGNVEPAQGNVPGPRACPEEEAFEVGDRGSDAPPENL